PLEFRLKNHVRLEGQPGERVTPANEVLDTQPVEGGVPFSSNGLRECLQIGSEAIDWGQPSERPESGNLRRGKGMGMFIYRGGAGGRSIARMRLESDGSLRLLTGLMDVGEGSLTVMPQIAAEELGVGYGQVLVTFGDSETTPEAPLTAGSTATFSTGTATKEAARQLKARIIEVVAPLLDTEPSNLQITDDGVEHIQYPERSVSFAQIAESAGEIEVEAAISPGSRDHVINSFGAHFAEVEVDTDTGQVRVLRYIAAHDSGRILNPKLAINQVEGGVSQMLGFTLSEQMLTDPRNGVTLNASFLEHKSPTLQDFPEMQVLFADVVDPIGPFGAKALGEPPSIGVAPAVANAIYNAIGVRIRDLPLTPDRVLNEIEAQGGDSQ
ncbi:MAG TPA: hypothetical protein DEW32_08850, partial [Dehalococcoidia bacterium]|nr:hypothetical protein [Dehalococcoidia bacterium]